MGNFLPKKEIIIMSSVQEITKLFVKDSIIVWHDPEINSNENQDYIDKLKNIYEVKTFTDWREASEFILAAELTCQVITAGRNGEDFVKKIYECPKVVSIYVFCQNLEKHKLWAKDIQKVACVKNKFLEVMTCVEQGVLKWQKEDSSLRAFPNFAPIFNDADKDELIYQHLHLRGLIHFQNRSQGKKDFLNLAKAIYRDKKNMKNFENNYEKYDMKSILTWYTRQSFFYKTTNNCLRISTPDSIQYCRLALKDIETAIKEQYSQKSKDFNGLLYRGTYLSNEEWNQIQANVGKEIEMLGFLSTSKSKNVAMEFIYQDVTRKILITIIVPNLPFNKESQGFAEMREFSVFKNEEEILFNIMSRFRILEASSEIIQEGVNCKHLVLLYGSEIVKQSMTANEPTTIEAFIKALTRMECEECKENIGLVDGEFIYIDISDKNKVVCKNCLEKYQKKNKPVLLHHKFSKESQNYLNLTIEGRILKYRDNLMAIPFYGYKCPHCENPKFTSCYQCLTCKTVKKQWCQDCHKVDLDCVKEGHIIIQETQPYTYWSEKLSELEVFFKKHQQEMAKVDPFFNQAQTFENTHNYEKAIEFYGRYLEEHKEEKSNEKKVIVFNNLARIYDKLSDHKKALEYYTITFEIFHKMYGKQHPITASAYNNLGAIYDKLGDSKKALTSHLNALEVYKTIDDGSSRELMATSYSNIASAHSGLRDYSEAGNFYAKALEMRVKLYGEGHPITATSYNNLGFTYHKLGNLAQAKEYYTKALEIRKAIYGNRHPLVSASLTNLGVVSTDLGDSKQAIEFYEMALEINTKIYGENHLDVASSYDNLGQVYFKMEQYRDANDHFLSALRIREKAGDDNKLLLATSYNNLGCAFNALSVFSKAEEYHRKALENRKTAHGEKHLETATSENNLGLVCYNLSKYAEAEKLFSSALETRRQLLGEQHPDTVLLYSNLGLVFEVLERYDQALEYHLKVVNNQASPNLAIASSYGSLGLLYGMTEKYEAAIKCCFKSIEGYSTVYGDSNLKTAGAHHNLGLVYELMKYEEKAFEEFLKALEIRKKIYGEESPEVAVSYNSLGRKCEALGKYKEAINFHEKAKNIRVAQYGEQHLETATSYHNLGVAYDMNQQHRSAQESLRFAHKIYQANLGDNNLLTKMIYGYMNTPHEVRTGQTSSSELEIKVQQKPKNVNICVAGNPRVGKSCFVGKYIQKSFNEEPYVPTIGTDLKLKKMQGYNIVMWDLAGEEKYRAILKMSLNKAERGIIMYAVDDKKSFQEIPNWIRFFEENAPQDCQLVLIANKKDVNDRVVTYEEGQMMAKRYEIPFFEVSAKSDENLEDLIEKNVLGDVMGTPNEETPSGVKNVFFDNRDLKADFKKIVHQQLKKTII